MHRETKYAKSGDVHIAYQVVGNGPIDLIFVMGWVSHIEYMWKEPHFARFLERLASFSRLILLDKRGTGMSDRPGGLPTLEERMDDVRAVMDAAGSERAALFGVTEGGSMCALFAATYPERTRALVIDSGYARALWALDYPWGKPIEEWERRLTYLEDNWGGDLLLDVRAPSLAHNEQFRDWWATYLRMSSSPGAQRALSWMNWQIDIRHVLPAIGVPTLVLHRQGDRTIPVGNGRYLAEHIAGAKYVELPGNDHLVFAGDQEAVLAEVEQFLTGVRPMPEPDRVLATILYAEVVEAVVIAARIGAVAWQHAIDAFELRTTDELARYRGQRVKRTATGLVATFDGPARAIHCAAALVDHALALGLDLREGLHCGECQTGEDDIRGAAVQIAARVMTRAGAGDILVSSTITDLVAGSGIQFEPLPQRLVTGTDRGLDLFRVMIGSRYPTGPAKQRDEPSTEGIHLSPREQEVAELIGRGHSNRQVADELSIAVATVERHVANIFNKLGVHSRSQIASWIAGQRPSHPGSK